MRTQFFPSSSWRSRLRKNSIGTSELHEDLPGCPARKSGEEWQPVAKRRQTPSWFTKAPPGRAGFFTGPHVRDKPGLSGYLVGLVHLVSLVCFVYLVDLVYLVSFVQPKNQTDRPNRPNEQDRLADFLNILLDRRIGGGHEFR